MCRRRGLADRASEFEEALDSCALSEAVHAPSPPDVDRLNRLPYTARPSRGTAFLTDDISINSKSNSMTRSRHAPYELIELNGKTPLGGNLTVYDGGKALYIACVSPQKEIERSCFSSTGHIKDIGEGYCQYPCATQKGPSQHIGTSVTSFSKFMGTCWPLFDRDSVKIKKVSCGAWIEATHQHDIGTRYKTTGIPMGQLIFRVDEKATRNIGLQDFTDSYNSILKYNSWPCIQTGRDSPVVYLLIEVSKTAEWQSISEKLDETDVNKILAEACKHPQEREQNIFDVGIDARSRSMRAFSEKKKSKETKRKLLNELMKLHLTSLRDKLSVNDGSLVTCVTRKVLKKIALWLARRCKKLTGKMVTNNRGKAIEKTNPKLARKLNKVNYMDTPPEVIITRPINVTFHRQLDQVLSIDTVIKRKFDYVVLPNNLRKPTMQHNYVCFLSSFSQDLIRQLLMCVCREGHEVRKRCWKGAFELSDIWLGQGHLIINPDLEDHPYTEEGGLEDYHKLHKLISSVFLDPATRRYPRLLEFLLKLLASTPEKIRRDHNFITFLINHPCLMSYTDRMKVFFVIDRMIGKLSNPFLQSLMNLLDNNNYREWGLLVDDVAELKDAYYDANGKPRYGTNLCQAFHFVRNFLNHTRATVKSIKEAEAAICAVFPFLMHTVLLTLILGFVGPSGWDLIRVISNKSADRTELQFNWDWDI